MNANEFKNAILALRRIDFPKFADKLFNGDAHNAPFVDREYDRFFHEPEGYFILASDRERNLLWDIIKSHIREESISEESGEQ